jgi:hypothetical protein
MIFCVMNMLFHLLICECYIISEERKIKKFVLVRKITNIICQPATLEFLS